MKTAACQRLRRMFAADQPAFGLWVTLESPAITEMAVALGLDWVVIDAEHGHLDWKEIAEHIRADGAERDGRAGADRGAERRRDQARPRHRRGRRRDPVGGDRASNCEQAVRFARYPLGGRSRHRRGARDRLGPGARRTRGRGERARLRRADHRDGEGRGQSPGDVRGAGRRPVLVRPGGLTPRRPGIAGSGKGRASRRRSCA